MSATDPAEFAPEGEELESYLPMDMVAWKRRNRRKMFWDAVRHPWPIYRRVGGLQAVVNRRDGTTEDLGTISRAYAPRIGWSIGTHGAGTGK